MGNTYSIPAFSISRLETEFLAASSRRFNQSFPKYNIPEFAAMANYTLEIVRMKNILSPGCLIRYLLHSELIDFESELSDTPRTYYAYYADSGIARVRKGNYTYTVMEDKSNFLWVHNGSIKSAVKIGGSFREHRAFKGRNHENGRNQRVPSASEDARLVLSALPGKACYL